MLEATGGGSNTAATTVALNKLTSGQTLTAAEKALLNISNTSTIDATPKPDATVKTVVPPTGKTVSNSFANGDGTFTIIYSDGTTEVTGTKTTVSPLAVTPTTLPASITNATADTAARQNIIAVMKDRFAQYGLSSLASKIEALAIDGATESTITLQLQDTEEYKQRFAANQDRIKKGLAVLSPGSYLSAEDSYRQTLRAYGLTQFDNDLYVRQFIANDISASELSSRVSMAVQRVQNADPMVTSVLRDYYGIGQSDMVAYILDPNQQLPKIQQQVAAAEIGSAARRQGLEAGVTVSEQLARQGITEAQAQKGYSTIADILPTAEKLSQIYGTEQAYTQSTAEQEVFNGLASAQRTRQKLIGREQATFSGSAGTARSGLASQTRGQF